MKHMLKFHTIAFKTLAGFSALALLSACAKPASNEISAQQLKLRQVVNGYASNVSRAFAPRTQAVRRAMYGNYGGANYEQVFGWPSQPLPGYGELFGGYVIKQDPNEEARDCVRMSREIPEVQQNFEYMAASLTRCLDRILSDRNPLMTYGYRNMPQDTRQDWAYLLNYRRAGTIDQFDDGDLGMIDVFAGQGY